MVAIWSGWVSLGEMCGFGLVQPFPGIVAWRLNTAITLPVGVEAYGAYAMSAWLSPATPGTARSFAKWSALGALALGMLGQVAYHLLSAAAQEVVFDELDDRVEAEPLVVNEARAGIGTDHERGNPDPVAVLVDTGWDEERGS